MHQCQLTTPRVVAEPLRSVTEQQPVPRVVPTAEASDTSETFV